MRIRIQQLKLMQIHADPDRKPCPCPRDQDDAAGLGGGCQRAPGVAAGDHVGGQTGMPDIFFLQGSQNLLSNRKGYGTLVPVPYLSITAVSVADPDLTDPYVFGSPGSGL
jgi:hypothetical protein